MKPISIPLILLCALLSACASITPLQSKPPYSKIAVNRPFSWGDGILTIRINMPSGTYTPLYEDEGGYYYQAPQKVTGRDTGMPLLIDGGLYLERNKLKPQKIYVIRNNAGVPAKVGIGDRADVTTFR